MSEGAILAIDTAFGPIGVALVSVAGETIASETILDALGRRPRNCHRWSSACWLKRSCQQARFDVSR